MKSSRFWDVLLKVIVAAITAAATALTTTSCMGSGSFCAYSLPPTPP